MKQALLLGLPLIILGVIVLSAVYVGRRIAWAFELNYTLSTVISVCAVLFCMMSIMVIMQTNPTSGLSHIINNVSTVGIGIYAILFFTILAVDLVNIFAHFPTLLYGKIVVGVTVFVSLYSIWKAYDVKVYHQDIELKNLVHPVRLAHLSDIHIGYYWSDKTISRLVDLVEKEEVDAVVITGDLFDGCVRLSNEVLTPFNRLTMPIYFVEGNHDAYSGSSEIKNMLTQNGIIVLDNKKTELKDLQIVGLNYLIPDNESIDIFHAPASRVTMKDVLPTLGIDKNRASMLLHHNPVGVNYASANGIGLYLAGHTHAGQMFPGTIVAKWMFPFNKGLYKYDETTQVYVSQGSGTFGPPMRLGTDSEVTIINLK